MRFRTLLLGHHDSHSVQRISEALDRMDPKSRLWTVLSITKPEQRVLWTLMAEQSITLDHFVPARVKPLHEVIHHGKNTLPAWKFFQKRFCRADTDPSELWGYNLQDTSWLTGPGYFVARDAASSVLLDYTRLPSKKPVEWPPIVPNTARLGRWVYAGMKDSMRRVSEHVSIGRAYRGERPMNAWFILCREDPIEG